MLDNLFKDITNYYFSISTTTRDKRDGEKEAVDYHFVTKDQFEKDIKDGNFLEWAKVHENYYGTSLKPIEHALSLGKLVVFDIDVQGFKIVQEKMGDMITSVFVSTPTIRELENRLIKRGKDDKQTIQKRVKMASNELKWICKYDYHIINEDLQTASNKLLQIYKDMMKL